MAVPLRKVVNGYSDDEAGFYQQPRPALPTKRIVHKRIQSKASYRAAVALVFSSMALVLFLMGMSYIFVKAGVSRLNWEVNQLSAANQTAAMDNELLKSEIAAKKSLDRIEKMATEELGMVKDTKIEYMVLSDTVVAQGKMKTQEAALAPTEKKGAMATLVDFFLTWKK